MMKYYNDPQVWLYKAIFLLIIFSVVVGCSSPQPTAISMEVLPTPALSPIPSGTITLWPTPLPTDTPLPTATSTPEPPTPTPTATSTFVPAWHEIKDGDTLFHMALKYDTSVDEILQMNNLEEDSRLRIGRVLAMPSDITINLPECHLIEDSEVVNGSTYVDWDTSAFIEKQGGYLAEYEAYGRSAGQIIDQVAAKYHVGPRALLATIEMMSGWVTKKNPSVPTPFGMKGAGTADLQWWTSWAAKKMMQSYYGQLEGRRDWVVLGSGVQARLYPGTNPGSAAIVNVLAAVVTDPDKLSTLLAEKRFQKSYERLFGEIEAGPVLPADGQQPYFALPWTPGQEWVFTGGPHGGFGDNITGWAALDFAPPIPRGCWPSEFPALAVAPGLVIESRKGEVWIDLDEDGDIRTGWSVYYLHLATEGRIETGERVEVGDVIGFPSCEGGIADASHLHIARMYEGQWMPANGPIPFQLGNWSAKALIGSSYDGRLVNITGRVLEARPYRAEGFNVFPTNLYDQVKRTSGQ